MKVFSILNGYYTSYHKERHVKKRRGEKEEIRERGDGSG